MLCERAGTGWGRRRKEAQGRGGAVLDYNVLGMFETFNGHALSSEVWDL